MIEPVLKKSRGFDYICLNVNGKKSEQVCCLGRYDKVKLPIPDLTRKRIEERLGAKIEWDALEAKVRKMQKSR